MINRRTAAAAVLVAVTAVSGTVLGAGTASASTTDLPLPVSGAEYRVSSKAGGALQWDSRDNGSNVVVRDPNEASAQQVWTIRDEGAGTWSVKVPGTNNAIDRDVNRNTVGAWNYVAADNQRWSLHNTSLGDGRGWLLRNVSDPRLCLARGADLNTKVAACNTGDPAQNWNLDRPGGTTPPTPGRPVIDLDYSRAPDLGPWLEQQKQTVADYYSTISNLVTKGAWTPAPRFRIVLDPQITDHPADARPGAVPEIHASVDYTRNNRNDTGFLLHEAAHVAFFGHPGRPWWLEEGLADWVRYYNFQPGTVHPLAPGDRYDSGYSATARFIDYVAKTYRRPDLPYLLNTRDYGSGQIWVQVTGRSADQLWNEMPK
ncbi:basic secretory protein-like protein [Kitasatospora sp. MBT66]|uniref:basic secretory protein-like protein n=1 Tax=Kitasatospora sp. MBT66 TaxID=1444769 RepID=UPI0005B832C6|nr:basic secretory protein-like protein [Kitasatospora sp. MBT66]